MRRRVLIVVSIVVLAEIGYLGVSCLRSVGKSGVRLLQRGDGLVDREVAIEAKKGDCWRDGLRDPDGNSLSTRKLKGDDLHKRGTGTDRRKSREGEGRRWEVRGGEMRGEEWEGRGGEGRRGEEERRGEERRGGEETAE